MSEFAGISTLSDLLAVQLNGSAIEYGLDKLNAEVVKSLDSYNKQLTEMNSKYCETVSEQVKVFGTNDTISMVKVDEFGSAPSKMTKGTWEVAFPLEKYSSKIGYTFDWLQLASVDEVNQKLMNLQTSHALETIKDMKKALFTMNSNVVFADKYDNGHEITLRGFWNGDGSKIPANASGTTFNGATHTHYIGSASGTLAGSDIDALIALVTEHDNTQNLMIAVNVADASKLDSFTDFKALSSPFIKNDDGTFETMEYNDFENRKIGYWAGYIPVYVKRFVPKNYIICMSLGNGMSKPLGFRQHKVASLRGLRLNSENPNSLLIAKEAIAYQGFGVLNRSAGAVLQLNADSYTAPTIA